MILWATGFRAAVDHLAPLRLREPGGGIRVEDTRAVRDGRVHLVGYGPSASTIGANRAGRAAARSVSRLLESHGVAGLTGSRVQRPRQQSRAAHVLGRSAEQHQIPPHHRNTEADARPKMSAFQLLVARPPSGG